MPLLSDELRASSCVKIIPVTYRPAVPQKIKQYSDRLI